MYSFLIFLKNNYIWFLVITIVLLFSLIGYLVETSKYETEEDKEKKAQAKLEAKEKKQQEKLAKMEMKKKNKKERKKDEVEEILDPTPTVAEAMQMKQNDESVQKAEANYDLPLMKEEILVEDEIK